MKTESGGGGPARWAASKKETCLREQVGSAREEISLPSAAKSPSGKEKRAVRRRREPTLQCSPFFATEVDGNSRPGPLLKLSQGEGLLEPVKCGRRHVEANVRRRLETIHPNPGPQQQQSPSNVRRENAQRHREGRRIGPGRRRGRRVGPRTEERRADRREARKGRKRRTDGARRKTNMKKKSITAVTWNLQGVSTKMENRG